MMRHRGALISKFCAIGDFFAPIPQGAQVNESLDIYMYVLSKCKVLACSLIVWTYLLLRALHVLNLI